MDNDMKNDRQTTEDVHESRTPGKCSDEDTIDRGTNPHMGEDPGLLTSTEDPQERRLTRNTM